MPRASFFFHFRLATARILFALLAFATFAFGGVDGWAKALIGVTVLATAAAWAVKRFTAGYRFEWSWLYAAVAAPAVIAGLQSLFGLSAHPYATAGRLVEWLVYLAFFVLAVNVLEDVEIRRRFHVGLIWLGASVCLLAIAQRISVPDLAYWLRPGPGAEIFGPFADRHHLAIFIALLFPASLVWALRESKEQVLHLSMCGVMAAAMFLSESQVGLMVLLIEFLAVTGGQLWMARRSGSRRRKAKLLLSSAGLLAAALILMALVAGRGPFVERLAADRMATGMSRSLVAESVWLMFGEKPWLGHGAGAFQQAFPAFAPYEDGLEWNHAGNDPLEMTAELGIGAILAQLAIFGIVLGRPRSGRIWLSAVLPLFCVWLHSFVQYPLQTPAVVLLGLSILALIPADTSVAVRRSG